MTKKMIWIGGLLVGLAGTLAGQETPTAAVSPDEAAIRKVGVDYVTAFNAHDAKAVAEFWSPEAVYTNRSTGEEVVGREAIVEQMAAIFAERKELKLAVEVAGLQLVSPNVAIENGVAKYVLPGGVGETAEYKAVYVRRDGKWLLDRVTDQDPPQPPPSNYEKLKELEWMVGNWIDEDANATIATECQWARNQNFLHRSFTVEIGGELQMAGMQIIGWDAAAKQIRSWTFDSDGGFSEESWTRKGDRWNVRRSGVLQDGRKVSAVQIIERVDDNTAVLHVMQRTVAGELQPDIEQIKVVKQP